jgi:hypothetical protein
MNITTERTAGTTDVVPVAGPITSVALVGVTGIGAVGAVVPLDEEELGFVFELPLAEDEAEFLFVLGIAIGGMK